MPGFFDLVPKSYEFHVPYQGSFPVDAGSEMLKGLARTIASSLSPFYNREFFDPDGVRIINAVNGVDGRRLEDIFKVQYTNRGINIGNLALSKNGSGLKAELSFNRCWPTTRPVQSDAGRVPNHEPELEVVNRIKHELEWELVAERD